METNEVKVNDMQTQSKKEQLKQELTSLLNAKHHLKYVNTAKEFFSNEWNTTESILNLKEKNAPYYRGVNALIDAGFTFKQVAQEGGEGEGEVYFLVYEFTKDNESFLVKLDGSYTSYDGSAYDDWFFVEPAEVTITVYNKIKGE